MKNKLLLIFLLFMFGMLFLTIQKSDKIHELEIQGYENRLLQLEDRYWEEKAQHGRTKLELAYTKRIVADKDKQVQIKYLGKYTITAYCGCEICCGDYALNRTKGVVYGASGVELQEGVSVASSLPFGTSLIIEGNKYTVQDKTAEWIEDKYEGEIIDLYFENHLDALNFGKQVKDVYFIE